MTEQGYYNCSQGDACFDFGPATPDRGKGSLYELAYEVPLCYTSDDSTAAGDMNLELLSIPHHAFQMDGVPIGQALLTISSGEKFAQQNRFQPWHKNTMHLGLTVHRDASEAVTTAEPWFTNFQYDGRVDWGKAESRFLVGVAALQQQLTMAFGSNYNGITLDQAIAVDAALQGGQLTREQLQQMNGSQIEAVIATFGSSGMSYFRQELNWRQNAQDAVSTGAGSVHHNPSSDHSHRKLDQAETAVSESEGEEPMLWHPWDHTSVHRRRLNDHDEWGGVLLTVKMGRFANVYTDGARPTVYSVIASVGGASGSLIGLIGMAILVLEGFKMAANLCTGLRKTKTPKPNTATMTADDTQLTANNGPAPGTMEPKALLA